MKKITRQILNDVILYFYHCNIKHTRCLNLLFLITNIIVNIIMDFLNTFKHAPLFYNTKCLIAWYNFQLYSESIQNEYSAWYFLSFYCIDLNQYVYTIMHNIFIKSFLFLFIFPMFLFPRLSIQLILFF